MEVLPVTNPKIILILLSFAVAGILLIGCAAPERLLEIDSQDDSQDVAVIDESPEFQTTASGTYHKREAEKYDSKVNVRRRSVYVDYKSRASNGKSLHMSYRGDLAKYKINFTTTFRNATFRLRYADDRAYNYIDIYIDGVKKGRLKTVDTGTWNSFKWHPTLINLGTITPGVHEIKIRLATSGSYGASPDVFEIRGN